MKKNQNKLSPAIFIGVDGDGVISFGSGQPDLPPPKEVFESLPTMRTFKYGLIQGEVKLREALAKHHDSFTGDHYVIANGASEALDLTFRVVAKPGDKILIHTPYYYSYKPLIEMNHLVPVFVKTHEGKIDVADFKKKVRGVKAVLINSPCNPTGRIQDIDALKEIERVTQKLGVTLISDEVYKDLIYERKNYFLSGDKVVTVNSFSKTFAMCGLRVGYLFSSDLEIVKKVVELKTHTSMNTGILSQQVALHALKAPGKFVSDQVKIWRKRRDTIYDGMKDLGLDLWKPEGAFYVLPKIKDANKFVFDMFHKHKVITYPGEWFGAPDRVRFSYALDLEKIKEGLERIGRYLRKRR
ncbi:MAG: aminotransferase class I/II-fold pyridoxal phosphate-dependent enzyme [Pseudomonadota bacterium]